MSTRVGAWLRWRRRGADRWRGGGDVVGSGPPDGLKRAHADGGDGLRGGGAGRLRAGEGGDAPFRAQGPGRVGHLDDQRGAGRHVPDAPAGHRRFIAQLAADRAADVVGGRAGRAVGRGMNDDATGAQQRRKKDNGREHRLASRL